MRGTQRDSEWEEKQGKGRSGASGAHLSVATGRFQNASFMSLGDDALRHRASAVK